MKLMSDFKETLNSNLNFVIINFDHRKNTFSELLKNNKHMQQNKTFGVGRKN